MPSSRRKFLTGAASAAAGGSLVQASVGRAAEGLQKSANSAGEPLRVDPIGRVEKTGTSACIRLAEKYAAGLLGLDQWSHVNVLWWFDKNDEPAKRAILQVHPRGNPANPLTGVFACRAPVRPNLIALSTCRVLAVDGNVVTVDQIDAFDGTPVLDLKPLSPPDLADGPIRVPDWAGGGRQQPADS